MTWLEIRPQDVWLFRDGKPFAAGEDRSAHSMFPPSPLTVQGALRQKISVSLGVSLTEYKKQAPRAKRAIEYIGEHGELEKMGKFTMRGPFLSLHTKNGLMPLFPAPADLLKHSETHAFYISNPSGTIHSDLHGGLMFPAVKEKYENLPGHWIAQDAFERYLRGDTLTSDLFYISPEPDSEDDTYDRLYKAYESGQRIFPGTAIYQSDYRFGVSTNALTSFREEGQLYQVQFIRPQPGLSLVVHVSNEIPASLLEGPLNLGGEQRQAQADTLASDIQLPAHQFSKQFKVIFLTPAYFKEGWQPPNGDWSVVFGHGVTLKSAVLHRPLKLGGWNGAVNRARSMHNYVAPGSVYYFEAKTEFSLPSTLTQNPIGMNAEALGFGQYATGRW